MDNIFLPPRNLQELPTYTEILESMPPGYSEMRNKNWRKNKKVEWRWRFFIVDNHKYVEISYLRYDEDMRTFCNREGNWITQEDPDFKDNLKEVYYSYSNS